MLSGFFLRIGLLHIFGEYTGVVYYGEIIQLEKHDDTDNNY